ncbi:MAG: hypothetical protein HY329_27650 [Chloroflexi bacterium]|nr:hypothetical protein [Chloroflexota bacterium]
MLLSPDRRWLVYGAISDQIPEDVRLQPHYWPPKDDAAFPALRLLDTHTGADTVLADLACAPAWGSTGRIAYVKGAAPRRGDRSSFPGQIVVRDGLRGSERAWTSRPEEYGELVWAQDRLLATRKQPLDGGGWAWDLVVLDGPGQIRLLAHHAGLVAISPDGTKALISHLEGVMDPAVPSHQWAAKLQLVRLVDGRPMAELDLIGSGVAYLYSGTWSGDLVVAPGKSRYGSVHAAGLLALLDVRTAKPTLQEVFAFTWPSRRAGHGTIMYGGVAQPRLLDAAAARFGGWYGVGGGFWYLECEPAAQRCIRSDPTPHNPGRIPAETLFPDNRSRPLLSLTSRSHSLPPTGAPTSDGLVLLGLAIVCAGLALRRSQRGAATAERCCVESSTHD